MEHVKRKVIAVCSSWEDEENLNLVINQLIQATDGSEFLPLCINFDRSSIESRGEESINEFLDAFDVPDLAGFLLFGEMIRSDNLNWHLIQYAKERKLPVFMLERQYEGCINLSFAYRDGFEQVLRHMLEKHECRDIVMVAGIKGNLFSEERIDVCRRVLEEYGRKLAPEKIIYGNYWDEPTMQALDEYFDAGGNLPDVFVCANDTMAIAVCVYLAKKGIHVPDQVMVSGFDGVIPGEYHEPAITTAKPDFSAMFDKMLNRIAAWNPEDRGKTEVWSIPFDLICRESCGCEHGDMLEARKKMGELKIYNLTYTRHIRAMGNFMRSTLRMNSLDKLAERLRPLFSMWPVPYYYAAVLEEKHPEIAKPILHCVHSQFDLGDSFEWKGSLVPDFEFLQTDPDVHIVMAQLLQNEEETMGYLVSGIKDWTLRDQMLFEEQALFLAAALNSVISNKRLEDANNAILRMAEHDYMTGLYNRRGFLRELEHRMKLPEMQNLTLTLFAMDMDGLKSINDIYGHQEGDYAIQCLAYAIRKESEGKGICARYGGDEFAFALLDDKSYHNEVDAIRDRIELSARKICGPREFKISASLGACASIVKDATSLDQLLAEADAALYSDKSQRKKARR